ncbi:hypothetical protein HYPDE_25033 [Hyphomicrobium denitrificans 1NES1]|uniref:Uncharacterized protein n=1 Tax=Hyphomicrobium denitrificans 1NES1 TaxID=670307 RepID=N0B823_9HYPH|nr:hypothetical protein [Hyphomicrobium denitrificans]AGK56691.1 hypothetical protein HYPDE_25033 [Hyphomicrobium denitrificans 1NES1]
MPNTTSPDFASTEDRGQYPAIDNNGVRHAAQEGMDILKDNPMLTLVAVGVLGFAIGTLAGRSSIRRRGSLDANLDSLQQAIEAARSGTADTVGSWTKAFRDEGLLPDQIPNRVKQQIKRLLASVPH